MIRGLLGGVGSLLLTLSLIQLCFRSCCLGTLLPFPFPFAPPLLLGHPLPRVPMGLGPPPLHMPNFQDKAEIFMVGGEGKAKDEHHHHHHHHHHQHGHHHSHGHKHQHGHEHKHDHGHQHDHKHGHQHDHKHGHEHKHDHGHQHDHKHGHQHDHKHGHGHKHNHNHQHGHDHGHDHKHSHQHGHDHKHNHGHDHEHKHGHDHQHGHDHNHHNQGHNHGHLSDYSHPNGPHDQDHELNNDHMHNHPQHDSPYPPDEGYITDSHDPELDQNDHNQDVQDSPEGPYGDDIRSQKTLVGKPHNVQLQNGQEELERRPLFHSTSKIRDSPQDQRFYITLPKLVKSSLETSENSQEDSEIPQKRTYRTQNVAQNGDENVRGRDPPKYKDDPLFGGQKKNDGLQKKQHGLRRAFPKSGASISSLAFLHDSGDIVTVGDADPYLSFEQPLKLEDDGLYRGKTIESRLNNYFRNFNLTPANDHKLSAGKIGDVWNIPLFD